MIPKLIVMLTYNDKTVPNAFDVFETSKTARAENWGFKDIGLPPDQMKRVVNRMKDAGKTTYLEVVRYSEKECCESASLAVECGFDYLMGTVFYKSVSSFLREKSIKYLPFCGQVSGSPSILEGSIREIVEDAKRIASYGVDGFDLLAYRHVSNPEGLAQAFMLEIDLPVVMAGSIATFERLDRVAVINPWGFTIGSAFFEHKFGEKLSFSEQIDRVMAYMEHPERV